VGILFTIGRKRSPAGDDEALARLGSKKDPRRDWTVFLDRGESVPADRGVQGPKSKVQSRDRTRTAVRTRTQVRTRTEVRTRTQVRTRFVTDEEALTPALSHPKRTGEGESQVRTRTAEDRGVQGPDTGAADRGVQCPMSKVQGLKSGPDTNRGPDSNSGPDTFGTGNGLQREAAGRVEAAYPFSGPDTKIGTGHEVRSGHELWSGHVRDRKGARQGNGGSRDRKCLPLRH
jgi:hypothetical protein